MAVVDLSGLDWTVAGWRPFCWKLGHSAETDWAMGPDVGPIEAAVPGSVQEALLRAGLLPDWNEGVNSRACEWVEHRHWQFETVVPAGSVGRGEQARLMASGLDYAGWVLVDGQEVDRFQGALTSHRFDLTESLGDGKEHRLGIVFEEPPREQGQFGFTSRSRFFKSRYNYSWDWCPRIVPIGIWDGLNLESGPSLVFEIQRIHAALSPDSRTGSLEIILETDEELWDSCEKCTIVATVRDGDTEIEQASFEPGEGFHTLMLDGLRVEPWWPNGEGDAKTYTLDIEARDSTGTAVWADRRTVGFKRVKWIPCEGAHEDAEPWVCKINGKPVFLQGANWVPPRASYADATAEEYAELVGLYRDMGCNLLRVWGGGILEKSAFYDACDKAGILVWQEFPLSSSGIENAPPEDPAVIKNLVLIANSYIRRRAHHVSLLLWCGGNELFSKPNGNDRPADYSHPCIAALKELVEREDPGRRFLPTSASGPRFYGNPEDNGKGVHHDVHGPWGLGSFDDLAAWRAYWEADDALFRSEVGMPGAASPEQFQRYARDVELWPPTTDYWKHCSAWWVQWDRFKERLKKLGAQKGLAQYIRLTQEQQAEAYAIAAQCCKSRFPKCGGFVIWMGHDCFPCPANNSVIDFLRRPKPAYHALKQVFTARPEPEE
ncbi:MAG: hypothetical protein JXR94_24535 [Candidatus Hydrogenedentes bacterium]|nr:hypothetical protein [Candidatus Hydrogenedentota bacterium]